MMRPLELLDRGTGVANLGLSQKQLLLWFLAGFAFPLAFQVFAVELHRQTWSFLLHVGADSSLRTGVERELGPVPLAEGQGMDGQTFFLIARDPFARNGIPELLTTAHSHARYRYRRILYPALAGLMGLLSGQATLLGMVLWLAVGSGLAAAATADIGSRLGVEWSTVLLAIINPGVVCAAKTLTADPLALGLSLAGLALWSRGRRSTAVFSLAAAVLTKETSLLVVGSLAIWLVSEKEYRRAAAVMVCASLPLLVWSSWVAWQIPLEESVAHSFSIPAVGMLRSVVYWFDPESGANLGDIALGTLGVSLVIVAPWLAVRCGNRLLQINTLSWSCLGLVASVNVWGRSANAVRALAPLWVFALLCWGCVLLHRRRGRRSGGKAASPG